jgi:hypothetical protein
MQEVLIDRGQFVLQFRIQILNNLWVGLHDASFRVARLDEG